jgi:hypothetical protein
MRLLVLVPFVLLIPVQGFCGVGEKSESVEATRTSIQGNRLPDEVHANYTVDIVSTAKLTVRQYSTSDGTVFAVAWTGKGQPPLSTLKVLGTYEQQYQEAFQQVTRSKIFRGRSQRIETADIVVEKMSVPGSFAQGRVYLKSLAPGVTLDEIK